MIMRLKENVFASIGTNPFAGEIEKGIQYDLYEAQGFVLEQSGAFPKLKRSYEHGADQLIQHLHSGAQQILELGSGTGIATRSLFRQNSNRQVVGVEVSKGMKEVSEYKFHQAERIPFQEKVEAYFTHIGQSPSRELNDYWDSFREDTRNLHQRAQFVQGDIQDIAHLVEHDYFDAATANQVLHWVDISQTFSGLHQVLRNGGTVVWNSASHFYDDAQYPSEKWGWRQHQFVKCVVEELRREGLEVTDYRSIQKPLQNISSITRMTDEQGFSTEQVGTLLLPVDFQAMLTAQVPRLSARAIQNDLPLEEKQVYVDAAILNAIRKGFPEDQYHKYDIVPIFRSVKR